MLGFDYIYIFSYRKFRHNNETLGIRTHKQPYHKSAKDIQSLKEIKSTF